MARHNAVIFEDDLRIPEDAHTLEGFDRWVESDEFPETGRIDFLAGDVEVDLSPEDLYTHNTVKTAIALALGPLLVNEQDLGDVFIDRARVFSRFAELSVEPDLVVLLRESLESGRVRLRPAARKGPDRFSAMEGAPDLVVEIVSDGSVRKDTERLPPLYAKAGVPELWTIDARGEQLRFTIFVLQASGKYAAVEPDAEEWSRSSRLGRSFRLTRRRADPFPWRYTLEHRS
jgi:Uma2 family endonuclease